MRRFFHMGAPAVALPLRKVGDASDTYKQGSEAQEQYAVDLDAPVAKQWVELKRLIIEIADDLGVGAEVSAVFDVLKAKAVGEIALSAAGTSGGTIALGAAGGVAAGIVGAVVIGVFGLFADDEGPTVAKQRRDAMRAACWRVLMKPTFSSLATEQDTQAAIAAKAIKTVKELADATGVTPADIANTAPFQTSYQTAKKLAQFYRLAGQTLSSSEQKLFVSATWLARLLGLKAYAAGLSSKVFSGWGFYSEASELAIAFPDLDQELAQRIAVAEGEFAAQAKKKTVPKSAFPNVTGAALALSVGAGALYYVKPELAKSLASKALGLTRTTASAAVSAGNSLVKKVST